MFGGGKAKFQPVFSGDIARAVEIISRADEDIRKTVAGKIIEAGGPDSELQQIHNKYTLALTTRYTSFYLSRNDAAGAAV